MIRRIFWMTAVVFIATFSMNVIGYAQEADEAKSAAGWYDVLVESLLPAVWMAVGPLFVAGITKTVNATVGVYVPRSVQVVLSGVTTAVAAGLTGDVSGIAHAAGTGIGAQILAATKPETLLTSARDVNRSVVMLAPLMAILALIGLTACKSGDGKKFTQQMVKISGDVNRVMVEGCDGLPGVTVAYDTLAPVLPSGSDVAKGIEMTRADAEKICAKVQR